MFFEPRFKEVFSLLIHRSNYAPGDEVRDFANASSHRLLTCPQISIFGFSRGAYTARMVSAFIVSRQIQPPFTIGVSEFWLTKRAKLGYSLGKIWTLSLISS
jgi:hypothetical protein